MKNRLFTKLGLFAHSWFATVVDGIELGQVYPFQLNQLKYEDSQDDEVVEATRDFMVGFGIYIHIPLKKNSSHRCAARCDRGSLGDSPVSCKSISFFKAKIGPPQTKTSLNYILDQGKKLEVICRFRIGDFNTNLR